VRRECAAIVQATTAMAHALGLRVVAQGVESEEQRAQMAALGCDAAQGHYFAEPMQAGAIPELLRRREPGSVSPRPGEKVL
jgi:EAL domain-containing protein (putative c-di-GMP-specific phosphodiesterase class I)